QLCAVPGTGEQHGAVAAQAAEVQLVQADAAHCAELGLLKRANLVVGCSRRIELSQSTPNAIQRLHGGAVAVLIMADDETVRQTVECPGLARDRSDVSLHDGALF